jgi:hypothetical protein
MSKLEDRLSASIKPPAEKVSGKTGGTPPRKARATRAGTPAAPKATLDATTGAATGAPASPSSPVSQAMPESATGTAVPDLNDPARPLHPHRIWPD